jgi:hypothetical protein
VTYLIGVTEHRCDRYAKEPLLHFLLAGGVLFGVHTWLNRAAENSEPSKARQVHVSAADVQWLAETWARQWRRPPTREELRGLVTDYLNEQLLAREARAIGLDDDDAVVRRRLAQKLTFMIDGTLRHAEPSENELQQFYEKHTERFRTEARISFTHIYFSPERRSNAHSDATDALTLLVKMDAERPDAELGDRLLIAREFREETEQAISGALGSEFARTVFSLRPGIWSGPVNRIRPASRKDNESADG